MNAHVLLEMTFSVFFSVVLSIFLASGFVGAHVFELNSNNFDTLVHNGDSWMLEFYAYVTGKPFCRDPSVLWPINHPAAKAGNGRLTTLSRFARLNIVTVPGVITARRLSLSTKRLPLFLKIVAFHSGLLMQRSIAL